MRIVQTLHSYKNANLLKDSFGWYAPEYHLMSWTLSCLQLKKYYPKIELYSNSLSSQILCDNLLLPYDTVHTSHNNFSSPHRDLWALPKIYTYSLQEEPFLHVDGDVFIFKPFSQKLLEQNLIAQNEEIATEYYTSMQKFLIKSFKYFPEVVKADFSTNEPIHAVNAGILGGANIPFFREYTKTAFEYVNKNRDCLCSIDANKFNVFFEQHLFYYLAKKYNKKISFLIKGIIGDHQFRGLGNFHEVPFNQTYLHLIGEYKRNKETCLGLANTLRYNYPDYYYRIISLFKQKGIPLRHDYYQLKSYSTPTLKRYSISSKKNYSKSRVRISNPKKTANEVDFLKLINETCENRFISRLMKDTETYYGAQDKKELVGSYNDFIAKLCAKLQMDSSIDRSYLYGRDIDSVGWYRFLFKDRRKTAERIIVKCGEGDITTSKYNWGTIWCGLNQTGVPYYKELKIEKGEFGSLIIPEAFENGFSIYDLEPMEVVLLDMLSSPHRIYDVIRDVYEYFEPEVVKNNADKIHTLIFTLLKQLVLRKAIKPYK